MAKNKGYNDFMLGGAPVVFPGDGVTRAVSYQAVVPTTSPAAVNVRPLCVFERRRRGGSRPGFTSMIDDPVGDEITALGTLTTEAGKQLVVVADGEFGLLDGDSIEVKTSYLRTPAGVRVQTPDDFYIVFDTKVGDVTPGGQSDARSMVERFGKLYLAGDQPVVYDPRGGTVAALTATAGTVPTGQNIVSLYRDRLVLTGQDQIVYFSRVGDPGGWDFGDVAENPTAAVALQLSPAGVVGDHVTGVLPYRDMALVAACERSLWVVRGDPVGGTVRQVGDHVGLVAPRAWCNADGLLVYLSRDGIWTWPIGGEGPPERWSTARLPEELLSVDTTDHDIFMTYDSMGRGVHLFLTAVTVGAEPLAHWWLDLERRGLWPVEVPADAQPVVACEFGDDVVFGCGDGRLRTFNLSEDTDDGRPLVSQVVLGPFAFVSNLDSHADAIFRELHGTMAKPSADVEWYLFTGPSAEGVVDAATEALRTRAAGGVVANASGRGRWSGGFNQTYRPRLRSPWVTILLVAEGAWAMESVSMIAQSLGRIRPREDAG